MYKILFPKSVQYEGRTIQYCQYLTAVSDNVQNYWRHKIVKNVQVVFIHSKQCTTVTEMDHKLWSIILSKFDVLKFHEIPGSQSNLLRDFEKSFIDKNFPRKVPTVKVNFWRIFIQHSVRNSVRNSVRFVFVEV